MPDPVDPPTPPQDPPTPPASGGGNPPTPPTPPAPLPAEGTVSKAEYERLKKEHEDYRNKVDPVLETLWTDQELLKQATEAHNRRLGKLPPKDKPVVGDPPIPPGGGDPDTRSATVNIISDKFEDKVGISKLPDDKKKEMRGLVGAMLKEMLDPKGNKTINQVFEEVSLAKLPWYLERAYDLVTKDDQVRAAMERGKSEVLNEYQQQVGIMGGMPSSTIDTSGVSLTPLEKATAAKQGVSEENYLKQKKEILARRG